ncbi:hypothetical protein KS4_26710 [Poriferisphaera corsica]|uniref:THUMP-like domain-containing protein n=1 Tax=Poriferisphaera corsica TaxID=2528020 RepID=A0A517YWJ8_9BACT|nr:hypothetical protein [Poriferisphaera corsica]QDU34600.1 hypothetical protein KS4_26710 [Poriferisphaera corsica]
MREAQIPIYAGLTDELLEQAGLAYADPRQATARISQLRKKYDADSVRAAIELVTARAKARLKFPEISERFYGDVAGVEMASSWAVGKHKAKRFTGQARVWDLCCGIGGDMLSIKGVAGEVIGYEMDALRAWMCEKNTGCAVEVCDVIERQWVDGVFHLDPARRENDWGGKRMWHYEDLQPGPEFIERLVEKNRGGCIKLAPSVYAEDLPFECELEYVSERGRLVQGIAWVGELAECEKRATMVDGEEVHELCGGEESLIADYIGGESRYLYTVDPSVERAGLMNELAERTGLKVVHEKLGLLTGNATVSDPFIRGFELIETMGWKETRVKRWLAAHDGGLVEVKTRGKVVNPDTVQMRLRGKGETVYTVFILRKTKQIIAYITRRLGSI